MKKVAGIVRRKNVWKCFLLYSLSDVFIAGEALH
jgi:hypothetical protein